MGTIPGQFRWLGAFFLATCLLVLAASANFLAPPEVQDTRLEAGNFGVHVRMEGPYAAEVPLQIVCYFKYHPEQHGRAQEGRAEKSRMSGAPVELDRRLGGAIAALRERGEFVGDELETLLLVPPSGSIPAKLLLLIGLGEESQLSLDTMQRVGRTALREATRLGVSRAAFAPQIRDQGNATLPAGEVARAVVRGALLAYGTQERLAREGLARPLALTEWTMQAGPKYYDETVAGVKRGIQQAQTQSAQRPPAKRAQE